VNNAEILIAPDLHDNARDLTDGQVRDPRQGRRFGGQVLNEILYGFRWTLDFDGYSGGGIANRASKVPAGGETIDIRPESNSLHNAGNVDLAPHVHTLSARSLL
jgi:hypothetical protein